MNYHQTTELSGPICEKCHHKRFPNKTIQKKLGDDNVKPCCSGHGYIFNHRDTCKWPVSTTSALNFKSFSRSLEQFFLPVGQNNFGNKILLLPPKNLPNFAFSTTIFLAQLCFNNFNNGLLNYLCFFKV